jgi:Predicted hydrolases or acyltransferases (alpha/beta hydrolase superfamily)
MLEPHSSFVATGNLRLHYLEWDPESIRRVALENSDKNSHVSSAFSALTVADESIDNVPIVLLHGLGATADTWRLTAQSLSPYYPLVAFDLRGHGLSDQPDDGYDLPTIAEDVISGMAHLGLGQVAVVGHGWGARVALALASRHPALVSHLILVDCPHIEPRHWPDMTRERFICERNSAEHYTSREHYVNLLRREMASFWSPTIEQIVLSYVYETPDGALHEHLLGEHQRQIRASLWDDGALSYYGKVGCPVLLIPAATKPNPGDEPPESLEDADEFAAAKGYMAAQVARVIPHCSVLWMPHSSHDIQLQRPKMLANAIMEFLQE